MDRDRLFSRPFIFCSTSNLLQAIAFNLFLHFPGFLKDLGARPVEIGLLFSLTAVASIAVRPLLGRIMDARGRRGVIVVGNGLNTLVMALYLGISSIGPGVVIVRVLHGLAEAMLFTALFTYAADCVPESRRNQGLMLFGVSGMLPIALGGLLGDLLLARHGYPQLFQAAFGFAALALLFSLPLPEMAGAGSDGGAPPRAGFRRVLAQADLTPLWVVTGTFSLALAAMFTFLKTFVMDSGVGSVGGFFSTYAGTALVLRVFLGWLPDRLGAKRLLFPALGTLAAGFLVLAGAGSDREVLLAGVLCGAGHGYTFPLLFGMVVSRARSVDRGTAMAIYTALFDLGVLVGGPLLGGLIDGFGYTTMFAVAAALVIAGAAAFGIADRERR